MIKTNFAIIGSGIVGVSVARELIKRGQDKIIILEKESDLGFHASGRNSGVLHSGLYYGSDSLKAKFCKKGNELLKSYCKEHQLPLMEKGKVIVTKNENEIPALKKLYQQAQLNGVEAYLINENELKEIEPFAKTTELALYTPSTAITYPKIILQNLRKELEQTGKVKFYFAQTFQKKLSANTIKTTDHLIEFDYLINAAGSYAEKIAHQFDLGLQYHFIPFKGSYKKVKSTQSHLVNSNIYPVPNPQMPFLGIHFTKSIDGTIYIGPNAIPALGRENYHLWHNIDQEVFSIIFQLGKLFSTHKKFRSLALEEMKNYSERYFWKEAQKMLPALQQNDIENCSKVGIRPQLIDLQKKDIVMDFIIEQNENSIHILNAISPAFTCSFSFAEYIVDQMPISKTEETKAAPQKNIHHAEGWTVQN